MVTVAFHYDIDK